MKKKISIVILFFVLVIFISLSEECLSETKKYINPYSFYYEIQGNSFFYNNDYIQAIESYKKAIETNVFKNEYNLYANMIVAKTKTNDVQGALEDVSYLIKDLYEQHSGTNESQRQRYSATLERANINYLLQNYITALEDYTNLTSSRDCIDCENYTFDTFDDKSVSCSDLLNLTGEIKIKMNKYKLAIKDFDEAIEKHPYDLLAYQNKIRFKDILQLDKNRIEEIEKKIALIKEINNIELKDSIERQELAKRYFQRALLEHKFGDIPRMKSDLYEAIKSDPYNPIFYDSLGVLEMDKINSSRERDKVLELFDKAIELDFNFADAYFHKADIYYNLKDYISAINYYNKAIKLNPKKEGYYLKRAFAYYDNGEYNKAINDLTFVINLNPKNSEYYYQRALAKNELNDLKGSIYDYTQAIRLNPKNSDAYNERAILKEQLNDKQGALYDYTKAINISSNSGDYYYNRGDLYYNMRLYKKAIYDFTKAIENSSGESSYYYARAKTKLKINDFKGAFADFNLGLNKGFDLEAYYEQAKLKAKLGDRYGAKLDLIRAKKYALDYNDFDLYKKIVNKLNSI